MHVCDSVRVSECVREGETALNKNIELKYPKFVKYIDNILHLDPPCILDAAVGKATLEICTLGNWIYVLNNGRPNSRYYLTNFVSSPLLQLYSSLYDKLSPNRFLSAPGPRLLLHGGFTG